MALPGVDHILVLVHDLDRATKDFEAAGFTVQERADTKHGSTRFRFVCFEDGSYILVTAFTSPEAAAGHRLGKVLAEGEGWGDYSFVVPNLDAAAARARSAGTVLGTVNDVRNVVASGDEWALRLLVAGRGASGDDALPFLVEDVVGRSVRIPAPVSHANGAVGVAEIIVGAPSPSETAARLSALVDCPVARDGSDGCVIQVGGVRVRLVPNAAGLPGRRSTGGMTGAVLRCRPGSPARLLEGPAVRGARIELRPA